jgi:HAD superfamily hydrolase (TIGR01490 family)
MTWTTGAEGQPDEGEPPPRLALFDLDHTLIDFDSGLAWTRFLQSRGLLPRSAEETYIGYAKQYVAGTLDIHAMHRAGIAPLARHPLDVLQKWARDFETTMAPRITDGMRALVLQHQEACDLCAIVTATTRLVSEPFARLFGVPHLVATEAEVVNNRLTGAIDGDPCFRELKVLRVTQWLADGMRQPRVLTDFPETWFYSDSVSDLPLLQAVTHPVAVRPDERLRVHALARGWRLID